MKKEFKYKILNPGGNKTALVLEDCYSKDERKLINDFILKENLEVEQVGFISSKEKKLEMAGGEFCVNATRCAIYEYLKQKQGTINLKVSGAKENIEGGIEKENVYAKMKINKSINDLIKTEGIYNYVELDGILQIVVSEEDSKAFIEKLKIDEEKTKNELKEIMKKVDTLQKAIGIILLEKASDKTKIYPIVWVKTVDTLYYETACGSGSLATAIYKSTIENKTNFEIEQPSGYSIEIDLKIDGEIVEEGKISGKVIDEKGEIKYGRI